MQPQMVCNKKIQILVNKRDQTVAYFGNLPIKINKSNRRHIEELFEFNRSSIWLQTQRDGFIQLDSQMNILKTVNSMNSDLLPKDISTVIQVDNQFWIKTNNLIYRLNPQSGKITSNLIKYEGGENSIDPYYAFRHAIHLKDSTILFASEKGFQRLYPHLSNQPVASKVSFSSLQFLEGKKKGYKMPMDLPSKKTIHLKHNENSFLINFFIADFRNQENNLYKFRLDNYDNEWQEADEPEALYRRLSPGKYQLRVKAKGFRYSTEIDGSLQITILPPWYWAWWSKSLYLLTFVNE